MTSGIKTCASDYDTIPDGTELVFHYDLVASDDSFNPLEAADMDEALGNIGFVLYYNDATNVGEGGDDDDYTDDDGSFIIKHAVLEMYVRGRIESEGKWEPFRNDGLDGYDAIEWAAAQPWSSGKVASQGGSYPGQNQWMTAVLQPPSLVCMKPNVASTSLYDNWM